MPLTTEKVVLVTSVFDQPIRLGVVGCARILPAHLRGIATLQGAGFDPIRITALSARRPQEALLFRQPVAGATPREAASSNPRDPLGAPHRYVSELHPDVLPDVFDDWRSLVESETVDAVLVLAPVGLHHEIALAALRGDKHVLIEKPLAISVRAAGAVVAETHRRHLVAGVAENVRYAPRTRAARWLLSSGLIGTPQLWLSGGIGGEWAPDRIVAHTPWRHRKLDGAGGPAIDHGVHQMHQIRHLMGPIDDVTAMTRRWEPKRFDRAEGTADASVDNEVEDIYLAQFRFASGAIGSAFSGWAGRGTGTGLDAGPVIYTSAGCLKGEDVFTDDGRLGTVTELWESKTKPRTREQHFPGGVTDTFALELLDFVRAIVTGDEMETSAAEGLTDLAAAFAILESAHSGQPVRVGDVHDGSISGYQDEINQHYRL